MLTSRSAKDIVSLFSVPRQPIFPSLFHHVSRLLGRFGRRREPKSMLWSCREAGALCCAGTFALDIYAGRHLDTEGGEEEEPRSIQVALPLDDHVDHP